MLRAHKITLDVNNRQATLLAQHAGYARVAYNHALADFKAGLDIGEFRNDKPLSWTETSTPQSTWNRRQALLSLDVDTM